MPDQSLTIRESKTSDLAAITAIYADAVLHGTGTFEIMPPDIVEMTRRRTALVDNGYPYLVAECEGQIAGYCYAGVYRARPAYRFSVEDSVYVAPKFRNRGIGRKLLEPLTKQSEARDYRLMVAIIGDSDNAASIRLHAAAGFTHAGTLPNVGWKFGRWLDTVMMVRALGAASSQPPRAA